MLLRLPGLTPFPAAWELQRRLVTARQRGHIPDVLILLEHPPVITIGRSGDRGHLLFPRESLREKGIDVYEIERGGSVTYHGPGQLVGYPILDLRSLKEDVVRFMRALEESIIRTLTDFGISGQRVRGYPGVWVGEEKIASVGVAVKRRVTMHGMALNVTTDLTHFQWINACGLGKPVTSMSKILGVDVALSTVADAYVRRFGDVYGLRFEPVELSVLESKLERAAGEALAWNTA